MLSQFGKIILTTSVGIMDHEEARRKKMGGKVGCQLLRKTTKVMTDVSVPRSSMSSAVDNLLVPTSICLCGHVLCGITAMYAVGCVLQSMLSVAFLHLCAFAQGHCPYMVSLHVCSLCIWRAGFGFLLLSIGTAPVMNEQWQLLCADHQDVSFVKVCVKCTSMILSGKLAM